MTRGEKTPSRKGLVRKLQSRRQRNDYRTKREQVDQKKGKKKRGPYSEKKKKEKIKQNKTILNKNE